MVKSKRKSKLKVFRTPVGFHDAYVAAPSQKAALEAWGSNTNLFSQGAAEQITDPKLTKVPLEHPGEVVRVLRGNRAEQAAELASMGAPKVRKRASSPKPSRVALAKAEETLSALEARQEKQRESLDEEEEKLERRRRELQRRHERAHDKALEHVEDERSAYRKALERYESG